jgi:hypothetical protein
MPCKPYWIVLFALAVLNVALAQDPTKAEPAHYKLAFENEFVQVINIHYGAHEKSGLHAHTAGVVVNLTAAHLKFTDEQGKAREISALRGEARWFPPTKHRVENLGTTVYDGIYIVVKTNQQTGATGNGDQRAMNVPTQELVAQALALAKR